MKLQLISDTHFECHRDGGNEFIDLIDSNGDVLLLAGDIGTLPFLENAIKRFSDKFPQVVMVAGNHSFWGSDRKTVIDTLRNLSAKINNYHFLDNDIAEINGKRFLGTTLWFRDTNPHLTYLKHRWSDFSKIKDFGQWVFKQNDKSIDFLMSNLSPGDVVLTHYLPSEKSIHQKYKSEPTNCFYLCDVEDLIVERNPALWAHGHSHMSCMYCIGNTKIVCNPFGYIGYEADTGFNDQLIIEV